MKKIVIVLILLVAVACAKSKQRCESGTDSVAFGDIEICLPQIDGMVEAYSDPRVKEKVEQTNFEGNSILAYYINNDSFDRFDEVVTIGFDDYFQLFVANNLEGIKAGQSELEYLAKMTNETYIKNNWIDVQKKVEEKFDSLFIGTPALVENYSPDKDVRTYILISKLQKDDIEIVMLMTMNILLIKERLVWLSYYKYYEGEESIKTAKSKNDSFVLDLIGKNR